MERLRVLQLTGSPQDKFFEQLSLTYARDCAEALREDVAGFLFLHATPNGQHYLLSSLESEDIKSAKPLTISEAIELISRDRPEIALPQMFCQPGMTTYRAILDILKIPYIGNTADVMSLGFDKLKSRAIVSSVGVRVPKAVVVNEGEIPKLANLAETYPAIVKPIRADNSSGVSLVRHENELEFALAKAFEHSKQVLIEDFIAAGREVRCGVIECKGKLVCLPLQEYRVDETNPIRLSGDKVVMTRDGRVELTSRLKNTSWQVDSDDPINNPVFAFSMLAHRSLGCRHYSLFDFRIDNFGQPWFLEAGLYCSFAKSSVISKMACGAGIGLGELFKSFANQSQSHFSCV